MISIINYGLGNIASIRSSIEAIGEIANVISDPGDVGRASALILPGVGSFDHCMEALNKLNMIPALSERVLKVGIPFLGICVGMQVLATRGDEGGGVEGLGWIPGEVRQISSSSSDFKIPHIGWNNISIKKNCSIVPTSFENRDFYFLHSYAFIPSSASDVQSTVDYFGEHTASICRGNIFGCQFHPERSGDVGRAVLKNFANLCRSC